MSDEAMERESGSENEIEIPEFDAKSVRRASRRGVVRAALIATLVVGMVFAVVDFGTGAYARSQHDPQRKLFLMNSATMGHPGYAPGSPGNEIENHFRKSVSRLGDVDVIVPWSQLDPFGNLQDRVDVRVQQTLTGTLHTTTPPASKVELALQAGRRTKDQTRGVLRGLPSSTATTIVVELTDGVTDHDFWPMVEKLGLVKTVPADQVPAGFDPSNVVQGLPPGASGAVQVFKPGDKTFDGTLLETPVFADHADPRMPFPIVLASEYTAAAGGGTITSTSPAVNAPEHIGVEQPSDQVKSWAKQLRSSDDELLTELGLHTSKEIKQAAANAKTYGFVVRGLSPAEVMKLLDRPEVRSISIADAAFDLGYGFNH